MGGEFGRRDQRLRRRVLQRCGGKCEWARPEVGVRCTQDAIVVDQVARGRDVTIANLRGLCAAHHAAILAQEHEASKYVAIKVRPPKDAA